MKAKMNRLCTPLLCILSLAICLTVFSFFNQPEKPCIYIVGDSTVKNGSGKGDNNLWGWGDFIAEKFDTNRIEVHNCALGGTSSRTFITRGLWQDRVLKLLKPGDFVIVQFGHNDGGPLDDTARARGTIRGTGNEYKEIFNPILKKPETVYTYGHYLRTYIDDTREKGANCIICSPVPRCRFTEGKTQRADADYGLWAKAIADETNTDFIPLNSIIADKYDVLGLDITKLFFPTDQTHTNDIGARINASCVISAIKNLDHCQLRQFLAEQ